MPRVLVVEDNDAARESLALSLGREGFEGILAANGEEVLNHLRGGLKPDLILLDMLMPVLDGWHFLEALRREGPRPPVPVIITTGVLSPVSRSARRSSRPLRPGSE